MHALAGSLEIPMYAAVGLLEQLWHFTRDYAPRGDIGRHTNAMIARAVDWKDDPDKLVNALVSAGWLDRSNIPSIRLVVHDWAEHCEDAVHMKLARITAVFVGGAIPRLTRLGPMERKKIEAAYRTSIKETLWSEAHGVATEKAHGVATEKAHGVATEKAPRSASAPPPPCAAPPAPAPSLSVHRQQRTGLLRDNPEFTLEGNGAERAPPPLPDVESMLRDPLAALQAAGCDLDDAKSFVGCATPARIAEVLGLLRDGTWPDDPTAAIRTILLTKSRPGELTGIGQTAAFIEKKKRSNHRRRK